MIGSKQVEAVIEHPFVRAVTLTGSGPAGRAVASKAGAMLKKTVLELGGSDPYLVLEDADIELAARVGTKERLVNSGQSCIAAKRFIVVENVRRTIQLPTTVEARRIHGLSLAGTRPRQQDKGLCRSALEVTFRAVPRHEKPTLFKGDTVAQPSRVL
jgi:hypothetical protein